MRKNKKVILMLGAILALSGLVYVWSYASNYIDSALCDNKVLETVSSPDKNKKVVIFTVDCWGTSGWATHASVINLDDSIDDSDSGNVIRIGSNDGKAWPLAIGGWPIIKAKWESSNSLILYYSKDSSVFFKDQTVEKVNVEFFEITKKFVEENNLDIRK